MVGQEIEVDLGDIAGIVAGIGRGKRAPGPLPEGQAEPEGVR